MVEGGSYMTGKHNYFLQGLVQLHSPTGKEFQFRFNWNALFQETLGSLAIFISHFHVNMTAEDKRAFCYLVALKTIEKPQDIMPLITVLQLKDPFLCSLLRLLSLVPFPAPIELPKEAQGITPMPFRHTPVMGSVRPNFMAGNRYPTTSPGMAIPLEDSGLDDSGEQKKVAGE